jgi:hypothetical protein
MPSRTTYTNRKASRLPRGLGDFASKPPKPEPVTPLPKSRPAEVIRDSASVEVTGNVRTQRPKDGAY